MSIWVPGRFGFTNKVSTCSIVVKLRDLGWGKELDFLGEEGIETMSKLPVVRQSTKLTEGGKYNPYSRITPNRVVFPQPHVPARFTARRDMAATHGRCTCATASLGISRTSSRTKCLLFERTLGHAFEQVRVTRSRGRVRDSRSHTARLVTNHADVTRRASHCARRPNSATLS